MAHDKCRGSRRLGLALARNAPIAQRTNGVSRHRRFGHKTKLARMAACRESTINAMPKRAPAAWLAREIAR
jgi:hypothetical protein